MEEKKLLSLLGLARRAGRLSLGNDPVLEAIANKSSRLVLLAADPAPRPARGVKAAAEKSGVPVLCLRQTMDVIGAAVGKRSGVLSVNDEGFAVNVRKLNAMDREDANL